MRAASSVEPSVSMAAVSAMKIGLSLTALRAVSVLPKLASYVEPLVRARAGLIDEKRVWRDLLEGLPQANPVAGDEGLDKTHTWERTYWGGALFSLVADVTIRERTNDTRSLDDALRAIQRKGGTVRAHWKIEAVLDDPGRLARLSRRAVERSRDFGWEATAERLAAVYEAALTTPRRTSIDDADVLTGIPTAVIP